MFPLSIELTPHARLRCKERQIDATMIRRQLATIPYKETPHRRYWYVPRSTIYVIFQDNADRRHVISVCRWNQRDKRNLRVF